MTLDRNGGTSSDDDPSLDGDTHWRQAAQRHFDSEREVDLTSTIVFAIADARGVDPDDVRSQPLYEHVNVAGIQYAYFGPGTDDRQGTGSTEFRYEELLLKVRSDGWIQVYEETEANPG